MIFPRDHDYLFRVSSEQCGIVYDLCRVNGLILAGAYSIMFQKPKSRNNQNYATGKNSPKGFFQKN